MNIFTKTLVAAVATGVVLTGTGAGVGVALATPPSQHTQQIQQKGQVPPTTIDKNARTSLTIHKFSKNDVGTARDNGLRRTDTNGLGDPLQNAVFQIERVNGVDLTTNEGWLKAERIAKGAETAVTFGAPVAKPTGANGEAVFSDLPVGLYRVTEISAPLGYESVEREFYVTLPITNPNTKTSWEYNVHVYPKNKPLEDVITKTVSDAGRHVGDRIDYTITSRVPESRELASYIIADVYDPARLTDGKVKSVKLADGSVTFNQGADFTVGQENAAGKAKLVITFTPAGLGKLSGLDAAKRKVVSVVDFKVQHVNTENALEPVINDAELTSYSKHEDRTNPKPPAVTVDKPKTYFGNVKVVKTNSEKQPLNEARFDIYTCDRPENLGVKVRADIVPGTVVPGLHVNDFADGKAIENQQEKAKGYCLVETKAHPGYSLLATPVFFQVNKGSTDTIALVKQEVVDAKHNGGHNLPLTGGAGITTLILAGGLIVLVGGGTAIYLFRRQSA